MLFWLYVIAVLQFLFLLVAMIDRHGCRPIAVLLAAAATATFVVPVAVGFQLHQREDSFALQMAGPLVAILLLLLGRGIYHAIERWAERR